MAKVAVTGAKGLIGSAVAAGLVARGHSVLTLGRGAGNAVTLDLTDRQLPTLPPIDALIHCAGVTDEEVKADRDAAFKTGMTDGMEMSYVRLDSILAGGSP